MSKLDSDRTNQRLDRLELMFEVLLHELKAINEGIDAIREIMATQMATKDDIQRLEAKDDLLESLIRARFTQA